MDQLGVTIAAELERMKRERDKWKGKARVYRDSRDKWKAKALAQRSANAIRCERYRNKEAA